jgi:hypothetical protein
VQVAGVKPGSNGSGGGHRIAAPARGRLRARPQRSPVLGWLAVLLFVLSTVLGLAAWTSARARTPYLALRSPVPAGAVIHGADLVRVDAAVDGRANLVGWADRRSVVGRTAARSLRAGDLLSPGDWVDGAGPGAGRVVVPVTLSDDRLPGRLGVGDKVRLVSTPSDSAARSNGATAVLADEAVVFDVSSASRLSDRTVVSVSVPDNEATAVAAASAEGRVAIILLGRG